MDYSSASGPGPSVLPRVFLTCVFFAVFLVLVSLYWPDGREVLRLLLIPGNPDATIAAAETFASELHCGNSLKGAAMDFFRSLTGAD